MKPLRFKKVNISIICFRPFLIGASMLKRTSRKGPDLIYIAEEAWNYAVEANFPTNVGIYHLQCLCYIPPVDSNLFYAVEKKSLNKMLKPKTPSDVCRCVWTCQLCNRK
jgi:hypothetical protein